MYGPWLIPCVLQDHDGDGGAAAAGLPLRGPQPHREGAHPLSGARGAGAGAGPRGTGGTAPAPPTTANETKPPGGDWQFLDN